MFRIAIGFATIAVALQASQLNAQTFEISSQSGFVYFPSPEGPGIPGCAPNDGRCDFGISGTISVDTNATTLTFQSADFSLSGNQSIQDSPPYASALVTGAKVNSVLVDEVMLLSLLSIDGNTRTYGAPAIGFNLEAAITGDELRLTGGRDDTPSDGDGYTFDVATTLVPEPGGSCLFAWCLCGVLTLRRIRRTTHAS